MMRTPVTTTNALRWTTWMVGLCLLLGLTGTAAAPPAAAHALSTTAVLLDVGEQSVTGQVQLPIDRLALAVEDPTLTAATVVDPTVLERLRSYVQAHTAAAGADGTAWTTAATGGRVEQVDGVDHLVFDLALTPPAGQSAQLDDFTLSYDAIVEHLLSHQILVTARAAGAGDYTTVGLINWQDHDLAVDGFDPAAASDSTSVSAPTAPGESAGFLTAARLGIQHILEGADHLLFLIVLLLPAPLVALRGRWVRRDDLRRASWRVVHVVTAFALGHSITLALAALGYVHVDTRVVESLIAVSIIASAVHAIKPLVPGGEAVIASGFGLVHGLAFAALIDDLGLGRGSLVVELLGFNLGIEVTQLMVVALIMPSLLLLSRTPPLPGGADDRCGRGRRPGRCMAPGAHRSRAGEPLRHPHRGSGRPRAARRRRPGRRGGRRLVRPATARRRPSVQPAPRPPPDEVTTLWSANPRHRPRGEL